MHFIITRVGSSLIALSMVLTLSTCAVFKDDRTKKYEIDPVCGMKVDKSEAFTYKYEGKRYFFDTYSCKESFIMNPHKFLENKSMDKKQ